MDLQALGSCSSCKLPFSKRSKGSLLCRLKVPESLKLFWSDGDMGDNGWLSPAPHLLVPVKCSCSFLTWLPLFLPLTSTLFSLVSLLYHLFPSSVILSFLSPPLSIFISLFLLFQFCQSSASVRQYKNNLIKFKNSTHLHSRRWRRESMRQIFISHSRAVYYIQVYDWHYHLNIILSKKTFQ